MKILDFPGTLVAVLLKPETPAVLIAQPVIAGDIRRNENKAIPIRSCLQAPVIQYIVVGLFTAMQRHNHRCRRLDIIRDVHLVFPGTGLVIALLWQGIGIGLASTDRQRGQHERDRNRQRRHSDATNPVERNVRHGVLLLGFIV